LGQLGFAEVVEGGLQPKFLIYIFFRTWYKQSFFFNMFGVVEREKILIDFQNPPLKKAALGQLTNS